jgi:hypothetical protein
LNARKLLMAAALCAAAVAVSASALAATSHRSTSHSRVSIRPWPLGVFGYVTSPASRQCGAHRRVVVFRARGKGRDPRRDKRIGVARARRNNGLYQWVERTGMVGRLYAKAPSRGGCAPALSKVLRTAPGAGGGDTGGNDYPNCSPYVSEGTTSICKFGSRDDPLDFFAPHCGSFTKSDDQCDAKPLGGLFPWAGSANFGWHGAGQREVYYFAYQPGISNDSAHLHGSMGGPNTADYTIDDGFAQNDQGPGQGDHFYTPDVPGQKAGEVGGPLYLNYFTNEHEPGLPYEVQIWGYLYLKR